MRKSLLRRGGAAALAASIGAALLVGAATPARADVAISTVTLSTSQVVLNGDAGCGNRTKVAVKVWDPQPSDDEIFDVSADVVAPNGDNADILFLSLTSRSGNYAYYSDYVFLCGFDRPGAYQVHTAVTWWDDSVTDTRVAERFTPFAVKRPASLTYDASPEPVKRGAQLTHAGVLKLDPFGYGSMYGAKGITLKIYFRATTATTYTYKGSVTTGTAGKYSKKIAATASGTWKIVYAGDAYRQAQTKYDAVKLKS